MSSHDIFSIYFSILPITARIRTCGNSCRGKKKRKFDKNVETLNCHMSLKLRTRGQMYFIFLTQKWNFSLPPAQHRFIFTLTA